MEVDGTDPSLLERMYQRQNLRERVNDGEEVTSQEVTFPHFRLDQRRTRIQERTRENLVPSLRTPPPWTRVVLTLYRNLRNGGVRAPRPEDDRLVLRVGRRGVRTSLEVVPVVVHDGAVPLTEEVVRVFPPRFGGVSGAQVGLEKRSTPSLPQ